MQEVGGIPVNDGGGPSGSGMYIGTGSAQMWHRLFSFFPMAIYPRIQTRIDCDFLKILLKKPEIQCKI